MNLPTEAWVVIGTLGGALIGSLSTVVSAYVNRRSEERKHFREIVVKAALEEWKHISQISSSQVIFPLANYIIHAAKICELALDEKVTPQNIKEKLATIHSLTDMVDEDTVERVRKVTSHQPINKTSDDSVV